jgi:hypothetical protein
MAKLAGIKIHYEFLTAIATQGNGLERCMCIKGLPETAKFKYSETDDTDGVLILVYEDESFPDLGIGEPVPVHDVVMVKA